MSDFLTSIVWGGVSREITQPYGPTHRGIDIGLVMRTPLFAARGGLVTVASYWGVAVAVDGTNQTDWYLHTDSASTRRGWRAERGAQIALSGMTPVPGGPAPTGPHLHFEVQTGALDVFATSLNPVPVLNGLFSGGSGSLLGDGSVHTADEIYDLLDAVNKVTLVRLEAEINATNQVTLVRLEAEMLALKDQIAALPVGSTPTVDFQPVLDAIAAIKVPTTITGKLA